MPDPVPNQQSSPNTVSMIGKDGTAYDIPIDQARDALAGGLTPAKWYQRPGVKSPIPPKGELPGHAEQSVIDTKSLPTGLGSKDPQAMLGNVSSLGSGLMSGLNPFHSAPPSTPSTGSIFKDLPLDMLNLREIYGKSRGGDLPGAIGMGMGTATGFIGPEAVRMGGKGLHEAGAVARAAEESKYLPQAFRQAKQTTKTLGGSLEKVKSGEALVQPIRAEIEKQLEPIHKQLSKQAVPITNQMKQVIKLVAEKEPQYKKLVSDLTERSALKYKEAFRKMQQLEEIISRGAEGIEHAPNLAEFHKMLEQQVMDLAKVHGVDAQIKQLRGYWQEMNSLRDMAAGTAQKAGMLQQLISKIKPGAGALMGEGLPKVTPAAKAGASELAGKVGAEMPKGAGGARMAAGTGIQAGARGTQALIPILRALSSLFQQGTPGAPQGP